MPERPLAASAPQRLVSTPFLMVTGATFVFFLYVGVLVPLVPRLVEERLGGDELDIGLNLAAFSLTAVLVRPLLARFAERHSLRLLMACGALLTAAATLATAFVGSLWLLLPLRGVQGIGEASVFIGGASLTSGFASPARDAPRRRATSRWRCSAASASARSSARPSSGTTASKLGLLVAAAFAACGAVGSWAVPQRVINAATLGDPQDDEHAATGPFMHPAALRPGIVLALGIGGFTAFNAYMPEHSKAVGLGGSQWVFATYSVTCLVLRVVAAKVPERVGLVRAVTLALAGLIAGLAVLAFIPTVFGVFAAAMLLAVGMSFQYPALMAMALNDAPESERTRVLASFTMFFDVGTILGALVLGVVAEATSKRGGFFGGAVMCALSLVLLWRWLLPWSRQATAVRRCEPNESHDEPAFDLA
ncbi:MAG: MFS transporter [Ilumatobacteraceae bacterium]